MRGSLYALSPRLKAVIEEHAPGVLDTLPLRIETMEGELIRDDYCVIDVILSVKGIDWANSIVAYEYMLGGVVPSPSKIVMRDEVSGLKIFRDVHRPTHVFIHKSLYDAIFSLKPKVTGTYFTQVW